MAHHEYDQSKPYGTEHMQRAPFLLYIPQAAVASQTKSGQAKNVHLCSRAKRTGGPGMLFSGGELPAVV
jgi:hypothetical protein